jgi:F-type H+-transporting ATPase subunit gamma
VAGSGQIRLLRRRIRSVRSTQKITRAMEMIAASRIMKAQRRVNEARPYAEQITTIIKGLAASNEARNHPLLAVHDDVDRVAVVVFTSDRGLAGAYNANALKRAERVFAEEEAAGMTVDLYQVGKKGLGYFIFRGRRPVRSWQGMSDQPAMGDAQQVASVVMEAFSAGRYRRVWLVYTDFRSSMTQVPAAMQLLPVRAEEFDGGTAIPAEFMFEPTPAEILDLLIPRYVEAKVFAALLESAASEHANRQRAMKSATDNAADVIERLSRQMNQARQDQVTTEISEIVGGAEALSAG